MSLRICARHPNRLYDSFRCPECVKSEEQTKAVLTNTAATVQAFRRAYNQTCRDQVTQIDELIEEKERLLEERSKLVTQRDDALYCAGEFLEARTAASVANAQEIFDKLLTEVANEQ